MSASDLIDDLLLYPQPCSVIATGESAPRRVAQSVQAVVDPLQVASAQGYTLDLDFNGVRITGHDEAGVFYARQTLKQILALAGDTLPCLRVEDAPDLLVRGYLLDVSRDRVPTMTSLRRLIDRMALLKLNQLQLYTEHTVAYVGHETAWADASPLTFDELAELEAYCQQRFIDMVPCQNLFGHMHRWLNQPEYAHLAECPDGWDTPWGYRSDEPFSLNPTDPASMTLSGDLLDQLASRSGSKFFNLCCDETLDVGQGKSREVCEKHGRASVYIDYLNQLCTRAQSHSKTPMFWGDIVLHHPELVEQVPTDAVLLNWGYEADHPFDEQSRKFHEAGVRFYVCPGTSSWCTLTGRYRNTIDNLRSAASAARRYGAEGYLITDWGDYGHWQPFVISLPGLVYGAGLAWSQEHNDDESCLPTVISRWLLEESDDSLGRLLCEAGDAYLASETRYPNATWWFRYLRSPEQPLDVEPLGPLGLSEIDGVDDVLSRVQEGLLATTPQGRLAQEAHDDLKWCVDMCRWVCGRVRSIKSEPQHDGSGSQGNAESEAFDALIQRYRELWLRDNRAGGLDDSVKQLTRVQRLARQRDCIATASAPTNG